MEMCSMQVIIVVSQMISSYIAFINFFFNHLNVTKCKFYLPMVLLMNYEIIEFHPKCQILCL